MIRSRLKIKRQRNLVNLKKKAKLQGFDKLRANCDSKPFWKVCKPSQIKVATYGNTC